MTCHNPHDDFIHNTARQNCSLLAYKNPPIPRPSLSMFLAIATSTRLDAYLILPSHFMPRAINVAMNQLPAQKVSLDSLKAERRVIIYEHETGFIGPYRTKNLKKRSELISQNDAITAIRQ